MDDPTTIALNLTFFGTLGVAFVMFICMFILVVATLVIAGVGRLAVLIVMALFGRFPGNDTVEVVRLPVGTQSSTGAAPAEAPAARQESQERPAKLPKTPRPPREPRPPRDWKKLLSRAGLEESLRTAVVHHPLLAAARPVPPVLAKDWAAAVAAADARAVARARAAVPEIKVASPDRGGRGVAADGVVKVAPLVESALHTGTLHTGALQTAAAVRTESPRSAAMNTEAPSKQPPAQGETGTKGAPARSALALSAQPPRPVRKPAAAGHMAVLDTGSMVSLAQHEDARVRS